MHSTQRSVAGRAVGFASRNALADDGASRFRGNAQEQSALGREGDAPPGPRSAARRGRAERGQQQTRCRRGVCGEEMPWSAWAGQRCARRRRSGARERAMSRSEEEWAAIAQRISPPVLFGRGGEVSGGGQ